MQINLPSYSHLIVIFAFGDELPLRCTTQAKVILKKKPAPLKSQCLSEHLQERVRKLVQMSE